MKHAYLINVHKDLDQCQRLISRLAWSGTTFFLHIDAKVDENICRSFFTKLHNQYNCHLVEPRNNVKWAGYSQVAATLAGLSTIKSLKQNYDYITFLSGQDYPLKSNDQISGFLSQQNGKEFIEYHEISSTSHPLLTTRFCRYHFGEFLNDGFMRLNIERALRILLPKRKFPMGYIAYGGSQWWTITGECANYILNFVKIHAKFVDFFKFGNCPDEIFFQSIIMNSRYRDKVSNDNLRHIVWKEGKVNPEILTQNDFQVLMSSNKLFARKFDHRFDNRILDMIDSRLQAEI